MSCVVYKRLIGLLGLIGILFLLVPAASAGGWAVVTLDQLPTEVVAGKPLTISFMIRQHGRTPWVYGRVIVHAVQIKSREKILIQAQAEGPAGHYVATLNFPQAGTWRWGIESGLMPAQQPMPDLTVLASAPVDNPQTNSSNAVPPHLPNNNIIGNSLPMPFGIGLIGSIGTVGTLFFWWRKRTPLTLICLTITAIVSIVGFGLAARASAFSSKPMSNLPDEPASLGLVERGQTLFVAKGCLICHRHEAVRNIRQRFGGEFAEFSVGPDLPTLVTDPQLLHDWLKDPPAMKLNTSMPRLGLKEAEIEALAAFLLQSFVKSE